METTTLNDNGATGSIVTSPSALCSIATETENPAYVVNGTFSCDKMFEDFLKENRLVFEEYHLARICTTWIIFLISCIGNLTVLLSVTVRRRTPQFSHTQLMMTHLALANLAFTLFILPNDAVWNYTRQWLGGDIMCRLMNMLKQFSMYVSSAMIMVMGIDRVTSLLCPVSANQQRERIKKMLAVAWLLSFFNALPGFIMFSASLYHPFKCKCPDKFITQCVDFKFVDKPGRMVFYLYTMCISFFLPLLCIIVCYVIIALAIAKMAKRARATEIQSSGFRPPSNRKSLARQSLARARRMSQLATGLITATFIVCWGPYYVIGLIHWFYQQKADMMIELVMLMSSYLNPCLHPLITVMLLKDVRGNLWCKSPCALKSTRTTTMALTTRNQNHKPLVAKVADETKNMTLRDGNKELI